MIEQTNLILRELGRVVRKIDKKKTEELINEIINAKNVMVIGYGRSGYVGKSFSMRLEHLGLKTGKSLLIVISGSGKTKEIIRQVNKTKNKIVLITMNRNSVIAKKADLIIELKAKKSSQPMRSLFEQACLIYFDSIIMILMKKLKISEKEMWKRHD